MNPISNIMSPYAGEYGYFASTGFDMLGGDIETIPNFATFDEALIAVKGKINLNANRCGVVRQEKDGRFTALIKEKLKTNPIEQNTYWLCTNIFFGRPMIQGETSQTQGSEFGYYLVDDLDMYLGDVGNKSMWMTPEEVF